MIDTGHAISQVIDLLVVLFARICQRGPELWKLATSILDVTNHASLVLLVQSLSQFFLLDCQLLLER